MRSAASLQPHRAQFHPVPPVGLLGLRLTKAETSPRHHSFPVTPLGVSRYRIPPLIRRWSWAVGTSRTSSASQVAVPATASIPSAHGAARRRTLPPAQRRRQHCGWEEAEKEAAPAGFTQSCQAAVLMLPRHGQTTPTSSTSSGNTIPSREGMGLEGRAEPLSTSQSPG